METVSSIARDNYQVIILISGIVENLTSQTFDRFYETLTNWGTGKKNFNANKKTTIFRE